MELRQLRHFISVARLGNLHRAAEDLHLSQQALSASLARLEQDLGAKLFSRGPHGVQLSAYGETLLPRALSMVGEARVARTEIEGMSGATHGQLRVGVGVFFAHMVFPDALQQFVLDFPRIDISVIEATSLDLYEGLLRAELDFVLSTPASGIQVQPQFESELLFETPDAIFLRRAHPLSTCDSIALGDLADYPWIVSARFMDYRSRLEAAFVALGRKPPQRVLRTDSVPLIGHMLAHSDSVALLGTNPFPAHDLRALGSLKQFRIPELDGRYRGMLAWRRDALLPAAQALMNRVRDLVRERLAGADSQDR